MVGLRAVGTGQLAGLSGVVALAAGGMLLERAWRGLLRPGRSSRSPRSAWARMPWVPVSYTHLDVYKRQPPALPATQPPTLAATQPDAPLMSPELLSPELPSPELPGPEPLVYACLLYTSRCV